MLTRISILSTVCLVFYTLSLTVIYELFSDNLPDIDELETFQPKRITKVLSADEQHLSNFREENRELLRGYEEIPQTMKDALTSIEDRRFFTHWGLDVRRIAGAVKNNILALEITGEGASTITQQLARNLYDKVGRQRASGTLAEVAATYARKIREQITAVHIERLYTKREIMTMYLNTVYFGAGRHGLKLAARHYFDKEARDLAVEESAVLAGLLKAPATLNPLNHPERSRKRRNIVLHNMWEAGKLPKSEYVRLRDQPIRTQLRARAETYGQAPYFVEHVRKELDRKFGKALYRNGFTVHTTLDSRLQRIARKHFDIQIGKVQKTFDRHLASLKDTSLPNAAVVQAAFVVMEPATGRILVMIGGRSFAASKFNRATQALRHPGSAFKPIVYTAALDNGRFPIDMLEDNAIVLVEHTGEIWDPENYDRKFKGWMTLREGLKQSRNLIAIKLAQDITPARIRQYAINMGITTPIRAVDSIGIGTSEVRLLELLTVYGVFPNAGIHVSPTAVDSIIDSDGSIIYEPTVARKEVLRPSVAALMTNMMQSVIDEAGGTGHSLRFRFGFRTAAAGKTGTTNNYADAWFVGFTPHLVAGVWVGLDDPILTLGTQTGASAALPLWASFMKEVYTQVEPYRHRANEAFDYAEGLLIRLPVCEDTHTMATKYCPNQSEELFIADDVLPSSCPQHGVSGDESRRRLQRF